MLGVLDSSESSLRLALMSYEAILYESERWYIKLFSLLFAPSSLMPAN